MSAHPLVQRLIDVGLLTPEVVCVRDGGPILSVAVLARVPWSQDLLLFTVTLRDLFRPDAFNDDDWFHWVWRRADPVTCGNTKRAIAACVRRLGSPEPDQRPRPDAKEPATPERDGPDYAAKPSRRAS